MSTGDGVECSLSTEERLSVSMMLFFFFFFFFRGGSAGILLSGLGSCGVLLSEATAVVIEDDRRRENCGGGEGENAGGGESKNTGGGESKNAGGGGGEIDEGRDDKNAEYVSCPGESLGVSDGGSIGGGLGVSDGGSIGGGGGRLLFERGGGERLDFFDAEQNLQCLQAHLSQWYLPNNEHS